MVTQALPALDKPLLDIREADHEIAVSPKTAVKVTRAFLQAMLAACCGAYRQRRLGDGPVGHHARRLALLGNDGGHDRPDPQPGAGGGCMRGRRQRRRPGCIKAGASMPAEREAARGRRLLRRPPVRGRGGLRPSSPGASYVNGAVLVIDGGNMDGGNILLEAKGIPPTGKRALGSAATWALTKPSDTLDTAVYGRLPAARRSQ